MSSGEGRSAPWWILGVVDIVEASDGSDFMKKEQDGGRALDLLLVDDEMLPMDGLVMMHALRSKATVLSRRAAAILMPGHGQQDIIKRAIDVGYHTVLPKPFSATVLDQHAQRVLMRPTTWKDDGGLLRPSVIA